jgi:hypothetical protein
MSLLAAIGLTLCGAVIGAECRDWWREREARRQIRVMYLRVTGCVLVDCELDTLVTYNEDDGISEIRDYCIMPKATWLQHYAGEV